MRRTRWEARTAHRSAVAALEITALTAAAHVLAGGHLPAPGFLLGFAAMVFVAAALTFGRVLRVGVVVPFVLLAQLGLHSALEAVQPTHAGMSMTVTGEHLWQMTPVMFWAHLVTTVVTAIVLLVQEHVVAAVATWIRVFPAVVALPLLRGDRHHDEPRTTRPRLPLLCVAPRRGPPGVLAASS
ncbi:hypothetical protein EFK50_18095 [Nocardioides marmoriginsengisoli]|uniref:Uncharacterized protein n=1 Tax=Nocardioides marmoriginsengisoli TaxID=661483 RepID=A0A3N0CCW0_9ACTN|nr:hypothetical protein [Nocardioides marmoriginsengisoli]RNL61275.1 hypothetical protein EFK50_18095 [Nocardioides marmoriginsengisoli]